MYGFVGPAVGLLLCSETRNSRPWSSQLVLCCLVSLQELLGLSTVLPCRDKWGRRFPVND